MGLESDFLHVLSGANLLINIVDAPCEFSGKSGTVGPDDKTMGLFGKKLASLQTSITFATRVRFTPTTSQNEATDDDHISGVLDFGNATLSIRDSVNCTTYALRA